jgi:glycosyltransferase involved in cell wall biosynthesis
MPEVVEDGVTGFVVPPNDPAALRGRIAWLRDRPDEARAMGQAGRRRVLAHFTWPRVVERCLHAYESRAEVAPREPSWPRREEA